MDVAGKRVGFCICASHHHLEAAVGWVESFVRAGAVVQPIVSQSVLTVATRFGDGEQWRRRFARAAG
ncbi:MAG TPA: dipicolinate synthase subunit B, partial [Bacillota bacterium]